MIRTEEKLQIYITLFKHVQTISNYLRIAKQIQTFSFSKEKDLEKKLVFQKLATNLTEIEIYLSTLQRYILTLSLEIVNELSTF